MFNLNKEEILISSVSVVAATLATIVGHTSKDTGAQILKDFLIFGGGGGIAYAMATAGARATSADRVEGLCKRSVQRLGLAASSARSASAMLREWPTSSNYNNSTGLTTATVVSVMLDQLAEQAQVSIGDLEEMAGSKISLDSLVQGRLYSDIKAAADKTLTTAPPEQKEKLMSAINEKLQTFEQELRESQGVLRPITQLSLSCPHCQERLPEIPSETPGTTIHQHCPACNSSVIAHRMSNGEIAAKVEPKITIECPGCHEPLSLTTRPDGPRIVVRNCYGCNMRILIDTYLGRIERSEVVTPLRTTFTLEGDKALVCCPSCMNQIRVRPLPDGTPTKVSCTRCTNLIEASYASEE
jgi:hypothetical protein